jgi:hypothetical protein
VSYKSGNLISFVEEPLPICPVLCLELAVADRWNDVLLIYVNLLTTFFLPGTMLQFVHIVCFNPQNNSLGYIAYLHFKDEETEA